ncbi:hypothetical protein RRF57_012951 [Xylaria bambusicola]|uniref:Tryptophan synthase beta chain-like PALP domain-containing protein n=1 Tax=Xylaria bambusicola TaxID=326684 RepID=A0AAN7UYR9_9PEZI
MDGYATRMPEIDEQMGEHVNLVVVPVGVGSFAQAVVSHYKGGKPSPKILTVEPDTAACLYKSLHKGEIVVQKNSPTVMTGLDCGIVSSIARPILRGGVDAADCVRLRGSCGFFTARKIWRFFRAMRRSDFGSFTSLKQVGQGGSRTEREVFHPPVEH